MMSDNDNRRNYRGQNEEQSREADNLLLTDRPSPHNDDAERAVLGAMMLDASAATAALSALRFEKAFYSPTHQTIFDAIKTLNSTKNDAGIDPVVLADYLGRIGRLEEVGGALYLARLAESVPTAANIEHYVEIVKKNAILRRVITSCGAAIMKCYDSDDDIKSLLDQVEQSIFEISTMNETKDLQLIDNLVDDGLQYLMKLIEGDSEVMGLKTGYETLDRAIIGLRPGEMFVLAARPSIGKTALALNMACYIALNSQVPVGIFSLEMPAQQLVLRMLCSEARVPMSKFTRKTLTQVEMTEVLDAGERLRKSHIIIDDTGGIDILELKAKARRMRSRHDVGVIFIDYLQLIQTDAGRNASRENEVSKISGSIKALAKELGIPIVILAQLNRQAEQGEKPKLSHLRESGAIEQDADVVALLHRDREKQYQQKMDDETGIDSELIIAKNRNGATGTQELLFFPSYTRFYNKSRVSDQDIDSEANA